MGGSFWVATERAGAGVECGVRSGLGAARMDGFDRSGDRARSWLLRLALPVEAVEAGFAQLESAGIDSAGKLFRRRTILSSPHSGADSSHDAGSTAPGDRAGDLRAVHAVPVPLAAPCAGHAVTRSGWIVSGPEAIAGLRDFRRGVGVCCLAAPRSRRTIRSCWTGCASRAKFSGGGFLRIRLWSMRNLAGFGRRAWLRWRCFFARTRRRLLPAANQTPLLSHTASEVVTALEARGALFFHELLRATGRLASEVEDGLWELVAAGLVTADGFENLRALIDPKRRAEKEGAGTRVRAMPPAVGTCCGGLQTGRMPSFSRRCFWIAGGLCSAMFWRGKLWRLRGGICS